MACTSLAVAAFAVAPMPSPDSLLIVEAFVAVKASTLFAIFTCSCFLLLHIGSLHQWQWLQDGPNGAARYSYPLVICEWIFAPVHLGSAAAALGVIIDHSFRRTCVGEMLAICRSHEIATGLAFVMGGLCFVNALVLLYARMTADQPHLLEILAGGPPPGGAHVVLVDNPPIGAAVGDLPPVGAGAGGAEELENIILEAVKTLNEPTGSYKTVVANYIEEQYWPPADFDHVLSAKLNELTSSGKLMKSDFIGANPSPASVRRHNESRHGRPRPAPYHRAAAASTQIDGVEDTAATLRSDTIRYMHRCSHAPGPEAAHAAVLPPAGSS
ncbi:hypothetical protein ZWY2020_026388 [Hordeum vulgare]|nr:hypothetical protein ZWY2020_026388 [Hordeum vulgare]